MPATLKAVVDDYEGTTDNWKPVEYSAYGDVTSLGNFIENNLVGVRKRKGSYAEESGTVSDKVPFCEKALKQLTKFDDLSVDAKRIAADLYDFVAKENAS
jgi:hypothetical protein